MSLIKQVICRETSVLTRHAAITGAVLIDVRETCHHAGCGGLRLGRSAVIVADISNFTGSCSGSCCRLWKLPAELPCEAGALEEHVGPLFEPLLGFAPLLQLTLLRPAQQDDESAGMGSLCASWSDGGYLINLISKIPTSCQLCAGVISGSRA